MKTTINVYLVVALEFLLPACNSNFLDPTHPAGITDDELWSDPKLVELFLNGLYNDRPGYEYSNTQDNITDEGRCNYPGDAPNQILRGQVDQFQNPIGFWAYEAVRKTNEFLTGLKQAPLDEATKTQFRGEARFLRAFLYFDMVKRYGGVPLLSAPQQLDEDLEVQRNTLNETFEFIVNELDEASQELPEDMPRGKASKYAALALKGRALLYQASPLYNEKQDASLWLRSAEASLEVINSGIYALYPDLNNLWLDKSSSHSESIFEVQYRLPEKQHSWDAGLRPLVLANNNAGQLSPLQELVDAFPMKNGKAISDPTSRYKKDFPYEGRDDRFYAFIAYNGATVKGTTSGPPVREIKLQTYRGGRDYDAIPENTIYNTITGYYTRKATNPDNTIYTGSTGSDQPWIEIRYAEVLLNYAEALNEHLPAPDQEVYDAINLVRDRAGITQRLKVGSLSKQQMRDLIHNERYIELCFEKKRYWDLRRWKKAHEVLNGINYTGVVITKENDHTFSYEYHPVDAQAPVFTERMYFMPIPQTEISRNRNLTQNPGW